MIDPQLPAGFLALCTRAMKREGFRGEHVAATMREGRLAIIGEEAGAIRIDPADVTLVRVGYDEGKGGNTYRTRIWRKGGKPLTLHPTPADYQYRETMRLFVGAMAAAGKLDRVERGVSVFSAWLAPALLGLLTLAALGVGFFALTDHVWWQRFMPALAPAVLFATFYWNAKACHFPRPLHNLTELDRQLP